MFQACRRTLLLSAAKVQLPDMYDARHDRVGLKSNFNIKFLQNPEISLDSAPVIGKCSPREGELWMLIALTQEVTAVSTGWIPGSKKESDRGTGYQVATSKTHPTCTTRGVCASHKYSSTAPFPLRERFDSLTAPNASPFSVIAQVRQTSQIAAGPERLAKGSAWHGTR
jgi:hypothetical protein